MQALTYTKPAIRQTVDADTPLPAIVDQLTSVQIQIAVLEVLEQNLKAALIATGLKEVCGTSTRAVISTSKAGVTVAWKDLATSFSPTLDEIARFSRKKEPVTSVRMYGYN